MAAWPRPEMEDDIAALARCDTAEERQVTLLLAVLYELREIRDLLKPAPTTAPIIKPSA